MFGQKCVETSVNVVQTDFEQNTQETRLCVCVLDETLCWFSEQQQFPVSVDDGVCVGLSDAAVCPRWVYCL